MFRLKLTDPKCVSTKT